MPTTVMRAPGQQLGQVRRTHHDHEWWFAVEDVCAVLMDSQDGKDCWRHLRQVLGAEGCDVGTLCRSLSLAESGGAARQTDCVTLEGVFRIVQSMPSSKAEVFKRWLARAGAEPPSRHGPRTDLSTVFAMLEGAAAVAIGHHGDGAGDVAQKRAGQIAGEARALLESVARRGTLSVKAKKKLEASHE